MISHCPVKYEKDVQQGINFLKTPNIDLYFNTKLMGYNSRQINQQLSDYTFIKCFNFFKTIRFIEINNIISLLIESNECDKKKEFLNEKRAKNEELFEVHAQQDKPFVGFFYQNNEGEFNLKEISVQKQILINTQWIPVEYCVQSMSKGFIELFDGTNYSDNIELIYALITQSLKNDDQTSSVKLKNMYLIMRNQQRKEIEATLTFRKLSQGFTILIIIQKFLQIDMTFDPCILKIYKQKKKEKIEKKCKDLITQNSYWNILKQNQPEKNFYFQEPFSLNKQISKQKRAKYRILEFDMEEPFQIQVISKFCTIRVNDFQH